MTIIKLNQLNLVNKRVFIRSDLNVPMKNGKIVSDVRICSALPTIEFALKQNAYVMVASHLGRPIEGTYDKKYSLQPIVDYLKEKLNKPVHLVKNYLDGIELSKNEVFVLENVRFNKGENENNAELSKKYANLCDIFVMDAFGTAHRMQSSTYGIGKFSSIACAGLLLIHELENLNKILENPVRPMVAIIGGSKISTKLKVLNSLLKIVDQLIIGGGIANTFIAANGNNIGKSLCEYNLVPEAHKLLKNHNIFIPTDVRVSTKYSEDSVSEIKNVNNINKNEYIFDFGDESILKIKEIIKNAKTVIWNGPIGVFEFKNFRKGTEIIAKTISSEKIFSVVGGGDTISALDFFNVTQKISYISTGGGAFLKYIESKTLPGIQILEHKEK